MDSVVGDSRYEKIKYLNSGSFGQVELALDRQSGQLVAIKFVPRGDKINKYVLNEILNHSRLRHPHIVNFKEVFLTAKYLAIVMEYMAGGDVFQHVSMARGLSENDARWIFQQTIIGVDYLHKMGVAYRDIKLENLLIDKSPKPLVKLCDFGYSKNKLFQSQPGSRVGTPAYLAPEIIMSRDGESYDGQAADIWSCGVLLYVAMTGAYPFEDSEDKLATDKVMRMIKRIVEGTYGFPEGLRPSASCVALLSRMIEKDPEKRADLQEILEHPWFQDNLPPGVMTMNDALVKAAPTQSEEELTHLVSEARIVICTDEDDLNVDEYLDDDTVIGSSGFDDWGTRGSL